MSRTTVVHLELWISPQIFDKNWNGPYGIIGGLGETDSWKQLKTKVSCHCPFNKLANPIYFIFGVLAYKMMRFKFVKILPLAQHAIYDNQHKETSNAIQSRLIWCLYYMYTESSVISDSASWNLSRVILIMKLLYKWKLKKPSVLDSGTNLDRKAVEDLSRLSFWGLKVSGDSLVHHFCFTIPILMFKLF